MSYACNRFLVVVVVVVVVVEAVSRKENHGDFSWVVKTSRSPVPVLLHLLALQLKTRLLVRFESTGASTIYTFPFCFNRGDAVGTRGIGV